MSNFIDQHWVMGGAVVALLWMVGGIQYRRKDSFAALSWLVIGALIALIDVCWGLKDKQWGGLTLGIIVLAFGLRKVRVTLLQRRAQISSQTAQLK